MSVVDHLFELELFAFPIWKRAQNCIKKQDLDTFVKRWPTWAKRLKSFPQLRAELFFEIFHEKKKGFTHFQQKALDIFFAGCEINFKDPLVKSTLSKLCLEHNWEALQEIEKYCAFTAETHTVIACAMVHEANDPFWDKVLPRPRIPITAVLNYIQCHATQMLPYDCLENMWEKTQFYCTLENFQTHGFYTIKNPTGHTSVLPTFGHGSLWNYAMLRMPNDFFAQKIAEIYPLTATHLMPFFARPYPLDEQFVYTVIKKGFPLCETVSSMVKARNSNEVAKVDYFNLVDVLQQVFPAVAPAFEAALQKIANETQRERLMHKIQMENSATTIRQRKM